MPDDRIIAELREVMAEMLSIMRVQYGSAMADAGVDAITIAMAHLRVAGALGDWAEVTLREES